jgi:hypothetical protein
LINAEVADKGGLTGIAVKTGYKMVQGVKPGFVRKVVSDLLPEFAFALEDVYAEGPKGPAIRSHFERNAERIADALLSITDAKAERSPNGLVRGAYDKLRGTAKRHVEAAVPRLGDLVAKHAG